jgi:hypothetical protein
MSKSQVIKKLLAKAEDNKGPRMVTEERKQSRRKPSTEFQESHPMMLSNLNPNFDRA